MWVFIRPVQFTLHVTLSSSETKVEPQAEKIVEEKYKDATSLHWWVKTIQPGITRVLIKAFFYLFYVTTVGKYRGTLSWLSQGYLKANLGGGTCRGKPRAEHPTPSVTLFRS